jgi:hypothetical protein
MISIASKARSVRQAVSPLRLALCLVLVAATGAFCGGALAADADNSMAKARATELRLIRALVAQGILPREKALDMLRQAGIDPALLDAAQLPGPAPAATPPAPNAAEAAPAAAAAGATPAEAGAPATPALGEAAKRELLQQVQEDVRAQSQAEGRANQALLPAWLGRISFSGDIRLRYIRDEYASDNGSVSDIDAWYQLPSGTTVNTLDGHELMQMRVRLNVDAKLDEHFQAGIQVVTAAGNDATASPVDLDVDLGRYSRPYSAAINLGYLRWQPRQDFNVTVGRMLNPYFKSDLIFADDLSLDGLAAGYAPRFSPAAGAFLTAGVHPLQTNQSGPFNTAPEQILYAVQAGVDWFDTDDSRLRVGAAYYDFSGLQGEADPVTPANNTLNDDSAPLFRQFGNTMFDLHYQEIAYGTSTLSPLYAYAGQFRLFNLGAQYDYARFDPLRLRFQADWVRNIGFNPTEISQRIGSYVSYLPSVNGSNGATYNGVNDARVNGYMVNVRMGAAELRRLGDWQLFGGLRYLERDAVPDAFTSPDYRLGGTDNQAGFFGFNLGLSRATSLTLRYISARSIDSGPKFGVDTWFLDVYGKF